jgi:tRNA pseudouridine38-40 synthase
MREVISVHFKKTRSNLIIFAITGNAFVKHMVRNITGTLVDVGKSKISPDDFNKILQQKDRTLAGMTAPPQGLFLKRVKY